MANQTRRERKKSKAPFFRRHHGGLAILVLLGWLVPPLAVVIRFGIGFDFFLNIILTCLGYFPGHAHNFFIQNIRNNTGRGRTPKWALKTGLIQDDTEYIKSTRQWGVRYDERNARNGYDDENTPYDDEHGNQINAVERSILNHGMLPAQPAGGLGDKGNKTVPYGRDGNLLEGLPDEDREHRRKDRRNKRSEYGHGLDEQDAWEAEQASRGGSSGSRRNNDSLLGDLEDPDAIHGSSNGGGYSSSSRRRQQDDDYSSYSSRSNNPYNNDPLPTSKSSTAKKSGKSKKSERYGIKADHADLSASGPGSHGKGSSRQRQEQSSDRYDIVDDGDRRRASSRRSTGEEDFLNHQF